MSTETRWSVELYHDEPEDAAVDAKTLPEYHKTLTNAVRTAQHALTDYWQTASLHRGEWEPAVFGVRPERFESDDNVTPWLVGRDYVEEG